MKNAKTPEKHPPNDHTSKERDSDHSGSDSDNDSTKVGIKPEHKNKFDKPKKELDPDTTGIDVQPNPAQNDSIH